MEYNGEDIRKAQIEQRQRILKSFRETNLFSGEGDSNKLMCSMEKAEENDIEKGKWKDGDMHPNGRWVWRQSANGGKGDWRVANPKRGGGSRAAATSSKTESGDSKTTKVPAIKHQVDNFMYTIQTVNSNFTDESKVTVVKTDKGNWDTYYDGKRVGIVNSSVLSEKVAKEKGWLKEDGRNNEKTTKTNDSNKKEDSKKIGKTNADEVKSMVKWIQGKNGTNWTYDDANKAMEFLQKVPAKYRSNDRNIINRMRKTLYNLQVELSK